MDAVDLGATFVFAITALAYGLDPFVAAVLGMVTCIGAGVARGLLTLEIPTVLRIELYAVAALAGGRLDCARLHARPAAAPIMIFGAGLCLFLRLMSLYRGWRLPYSKYSKETD